MMPIDDEDVNPDDLEEPNTCVDCGEELPDSNTAGCEWCGVLCEECMAEHFGDGDKACVIAELKERGEWPE